MARPEGLEPPAYWFEANRSIRLSYGRASALPLYDSCLIQDEPETGTGFSHKMSLKGRVGMLGIDHQHGRFGSDKPGADPGVSGRQRRGAIYGAAPRRGLRVDGANAGTASVREPEQTGKGTGTPVCGPHDRPEPGTGDTADRGLYRYGSGKGGYISKEEVSPAGTPGPTWNCWHMWTKLTAI